MDPSEPMRNATGVSLARLEHELRRADRFDEASWREGLEADVIAAKLESAGLDVSPDVIDLYSWHDGAMYDPNIPPAKRELPRGWTMLRLDSALEHRQLLLNGAAEIPDEPEFDDMRFFPFFLPWATAGGSGGWLVIDCRPRQFTDVTVLNYHTDGTEWVAASLAACIKDLIRALEGEDDWS